MAVRIAKKEDARSISSIMSYSFNFGNRNIEETSKNFDHQGWLVNEENNQVTSAVKVHDYLMMYEGKYVKMGGVGGVCSSPENRSGGTVKDILTYSLEYMNNQDFYFSALGPFSFEFYRKYGWEWGFSFQLVNIPIDHLKNFKPAYKYVCLDKKDNELIENYRNQFIATINGPLYHSEKILEDRWNNFYNNFTHVYASYNQDNTLTAIAFFRIQDKTLHCDEIYFTSEEGRQHMLHLFYRHRSQINNVEMQLLTCDNIRTILPSPRIQYWEWPHMMIRIINVKKVLESLKCNVKGTIKLKVIDKQAPWNNQIFKISGDGSSLKVEEGCKNYDFAITIQRLSQLAIGFLSGKEAFDLNLVEIKNLKKISIFTQIFLKRKTMLWQMF